jgi:glycosyltransferase involved in cell wall biosynthesis
MIGKLLHRVAEFYKGPDAARSSDPLRIGIFGNINNYPLALAMGLRKLGHQAVLVVNRKEPLHRPESRYGEFAQRYPDWILDCSDIPEDDFVAGSPRIGHVINFLSTSSSGLILNDLGPSLLEYCPGPAVALMTGSDLSYFADYRMLEIRRNWWPSGYTCTPGGRLATQKWAEFIGRQRRGVLAAQAVSCPFPGLVPEIDDLLRAIGVADARRIFVYLTGAIDRTPLLKEGTGKLRILNGARLNWKKPMPPGFSGQDHKGTDILLRGFAQFLQAGGQGELLLFRKGLHVEETETLANELGISKDIIWRSELGLNEFYAEIEQADIVCDQFGDSFPGLVALDAMALGRPVIANFRPPIISSSYPEPIPAFQAECAEDVKNHLLKLAASPDLRRSVGLAGRRFAETYLSPEANAIKCLKAMGLER